MFLAGIESIGSLGCAVENGRDQAIRFVVAGLSPLPGNFAGRGARLFRPGQALPSLGLDRPEREPAGPGVGHGAGGGREPRPRRSDARAARATRLPRTARGKCRGSAAPFAVGHRRRSVVVRHRHAGRHRRPGLAQICRERVPQLPVLLTSGFSEAPQAARPLRHPAQAVRAFRAGARDQHRLEERR